MSSSSSACAACGVVDIPSAAVVNMRAGWLWWRLAKPVHPWCDPIWAQLDAAARKKIMVMLDRVRREAA